jgi:two-component system, OmpR family, sensor histidine kinase BaeS
MTRLWILLLVAGIMLGGLASASFHKSLRSRLSVRIAALILVSGPLALIVIVGLNGFFYGSLHEAAPWWSRLFQLFLIVLGVPLILGLLAARYVTKPLSQFNKAIASLKENNYQVELRTSGVREFDKVFNEFNDLTKRLRQEEELRRNLISDTSHELNTPITAMLSQLTAMQDEVLPITKERIRTLTNQTERLAELVAQLNAYTKARSLPSLEVKESIDLAAFCKDLQDLFGPQLQQRGMELRLDIPQGYVLSANRQSLERILTNLLQNALRYSDGTQIAIQASKVQLVVSDNGRGVPAASLPHLFERFYRVDASRSRETGGLGLGLAIVRELVQRQGWRIRAEGAYPGLRVVFNLAADS